MKEFTIQDTLRVSDSKIKGFVILQDQEGNTIFAKPNMIVEKGREFVRDLVYNQVSAGSMTRKFTVIKFGSGTATSTYDMTDLVTEEATIGDIDINITDLVWSESLVYTQGVAADLPTGTFTGQLYYATDEDAVYIYTADATNAWDDGTIATVEATGITLPGTTTFGSYFYKSTNNKLYRTARVLEKIPADIGLGLKITIDVIGNGGITDAITELGLFTDTTADEELFSRVVFDAIPLTENFSYKLTYYIYF